MTRQRPSRLRSVAVTLVWMMLVSVLLVLPSGAEASTYRSEATITLTPQQYVTVAGLALGDTDDDGAAEIVATYDWYFGTPGTPRMVFYQKTGSSYELEVAVDNVVLSAGVGGLGPTPRRIPLADLNLDGTLEIVVAGSVAGISGLYAFQWNGTGYAVLASVSGSFGDAVVGDGDGDGVAEVIVTASSSVNAYEWVSGQLTLEDTFTPAVPFSRLAVGEVDADSVPEIVLSTNYLDVASYMKGPSGYALEGSGSVSYGYVDRDMVLADTDGDGQSEVVRLDYWLNVVVYGWSGNKFVVEWNGSGLPSEGWGSTSLAAGDMDDDGATEFLVANDARVGSDSMALFEYADGSYTIDWYSGYLDGYVNLAVVGDSDGDAATEIVAGSVAWSTVWVYALDLGDQPPVAVAEANPTTAHLGEGITFSGAGSTDDHGIQAFDWDFGDGTSGVPGAQVVHSYAARGNFTATLTVTDTGGQKATDTVAVSIVNRAPVADAGVDFSAWKHVAFPLDGSASTDGDGDLLTYLWSQVSGPAIPLAGVTSVVASANATISGTYGFELRVSDGHGGEATDRVSVLVPNRAPMANAGTDASVSKYATFHLDGRGSVDPDGDPLTYQWSQVGGTALTIENGTCAIASARSNRSGTFEFELSVWDDEGVPATDRVSVAIPNRSPIADAGADQTVPKNSSVTLDASGSSDEDGELLTFAWQQISGPAVTLSASNAPTATFVPEIGGRYSFLLTLVDPEDAYAFDLVNVTVVDRAPTLDAALPGSPVRLVVGESQDFLVTGSDPDGDPLTFVWRLDEIETGTEGGSYTFHATVAGSYRVNVTVSDGTNVVWREWTVEVQTAPGSEGILPTWALAGAAVACLAAVGAAVLLWRRKRIRSS